MPRKTTKTKTEPSQTGTAVAERAPEEATTTVPTTPPTDGTGKNYGPPYKAIFTSADKGFELGENRRFKQRVFTFKDKPDPLVIERLKEQGFTYRAAEKAWTVEATAESRVLSDRLAQEFAGKDQSAGRG